MASNRNRAEEVEAHLHGSSLNVRRGCDGGAGTRATGGQNRSYRGLAV